MVTPHQLSRTQARRIAVRAQGLDAPRPTQLTDVVGQLTLLQHSTTKAVAPSAELVIWSRLGSSYSLGELAAAQAAGTVLDLQGMLRPAEDLALYRADMAAWPGKGPLHEWQEARRDWVVANDATRRDILQKLYDEGPLGSRAFPDTTAIPWQSTGWNSGRSIRMLLDCMVERGEVAVAERGAREPLWDLAERVYPDDPVVPLQEARRIRDEKRLHALGIARARGPDCPVEPLDVGAAGEPAVVEGVRGEWRVDPSYLGGRFRGRAALLSPLDRLVYDRKRTKEIFEFDYALEMYTPAAKRRWGYWALPILYGDRLVGKLDTFADHKSGMLRVHAIHQDVAFTATMSAAIEREIHSLARWLDLEPLYAD